MHDVIRDNRHELIYGEHREQIVDIDYNKDVRNQDKDFDGAHGQVPNFEL